MKKAFVIKDKNEKEFPYWFKSDSGYFRTTSDDLSHKFEKREYAEEFILTKGELADYEIREIEYDENVGEI